MNIIKDVLLQHFLCLMPFGLFSIYYRDKMKNYDRRFIIIVSVVSLFLSMTFAASVTEGFYFDSRFVILFFGIVFGGLQTGLILLVEFILYRLYIGGDGVWLAMITVSIAFSICTLLYKVYLKTSRKSLVILTAGVMISIIPVTTVYIVHPADVTSHFVFHFVVSFQNAIGIWFLMALFQRAVSNKELFMKYAQNEKMEAVSHVAASLAHEVRNPLTAVKGFLKLIRENPADRVKVEGYIDICTEEIDRTESILTEYLSISKPVTEKQEIVNLSQQLNAIVDVMKPYANMHNVQLHTESEDQFVYIFANPDKIKQVFLNFIKNAIEACMDVTNGEVSLRLSIADRNVMLTIRDTGVGMSEEEVNRLGSIYFSTKMKGTGLGLAFSYQAIYDLGGSVSAWSTPQAGTEFTIILPMTLMD